MFKDLICARTYDTYGQQHVAIGAALSDKAWWDGLASTKMAVDYRWDGCDLPIHLYIGRLLTVLARAK